MIVRISDIIQHPVITSKQQTDKYNQSFKCKLDKLIKINKNIYEINEHH